MIVRRSKEGKLDQKTKEFSGATKLDGMGRARGRDGNSKAKTYLSDFFIVLIKSPIETTLKNICKTLHEEKIKCCRYRLEQFFLVGNDGDLYQGNDNGSR